MKLLKSIQHKAFTLAELMVVLAVMTVVIAAVAPVLTAKYNALMSSEVWHEVPADNNGDIYTDGINHLILQQIMVGVSPLDLNDIRTNYDPFSKFVIRASDKVDGNTVQAPIEFYHNGNRQGVLIAGKENLLLVGNYANIRGLGNDIANLDDMNKIAAIAVGNTAFGYGALDNITNGKGNTAIGRRALGTVTSGSFNTAIGAFAGNTTTSGNNNVYIGYSASARNRNGINGSINGSDNTIISNDTDVEAIRSTAIGENAQFAGSDNVALGYSAHAAGGDMNTMVGSYTGRNSGSNVTAIGYKSCSLLPANMGNKTCIGQAAAYEGYSESTLSTNTSQVLIGRGNSNYNSAAAVVVSPSGGDVSAGNNSTIGDASVVIYGNLIVRGQTYMYGKSPFPQNGRAFAPSYNDSLMGYTLYNAVEGDHKPFVGLDGSGTTVALTGTDGYMHQVYGGREHCICTQSLSSYDWTSSVQLPYTFDNLLGEYSYFYSLPAEAEDSGYPSIELSRSHALSGRTFAGSDGIVHTIGVAEGSCCPILTQGGVRRRMSDSRLKNIGEKFTAGLDKLEKIKIYNYTFKSDKSKKRHVGVIAQDLKAIFPNSVSKDEKGYYKIRWDEMFYSAINSVKELNAKITALTARIKNDFDRIVKLKQENKKLEDKLIKLADEIEKLEQKR